MNIIPLARGVYEPNSVMALTRPEQVIALTTQGKLCDPLACRSCLMNDRKGDLPINLGSKLGMVFLECLGLDLSVKELTAKAKSMFEIDYLPPETKTVFTVNPGNPGLSWFDFSLFFFANPRVTLTEARQSQAEYTRLCHLDFFTPELAHPLLFACGLSLYQNSMPV